MHKKDHTFLFLSFLFLGGEGGRGGGGEGGHWLVLNLIYTCQSNICFFLFKVPNQSQLWNRMRPRVLMFFYSQILYTWLNENWFCLMPMSPSVPEMWGGGSFFDEVPLVELIYLVFTHMPGETQVFVVLVLCISSTNSLVGCFCTSTLGLVLFQICDNSLWG